MSNRIYVPYTLFNLRIVNMQHLWTPSNEYMGKPTTKPNYFATCVLDRTQQNWWEEPALAQAWAAFSELLNKSGMQPNMITGWPIKDGNMPPEPGKPPSDWAKNRWIIGGSSSSPIKVEMAQPNGTVTPLPAKVGVKPGDYVALGLSAAIKQNDARGIKNYCNTVLFMSACAADQEIVVGAGGVSGAELHAQAVRQGLQVAGFQPAPQSYAPQAFQPGPGAPPAGFPSHGAPPSPGPQGAPSTGGPATPVYGAPAPGGAFAPGGGSVTYPSNTAGQPPNSPAPAFQPPYGTVNPGPQPTFQPQPAPGGAQWQTPPNFAPGGPR